MSYRLNLPELPDTSLISRIGNVLSRMAEYLERREPLVARAQSLQFERNRLMSALLDMMVTHADVLNQAGALEPIQSIVSDLIENEMENMDLLVEMCENMIQMTTDIGEKLHE